MARDRRSPSDAEARPEARPQGKSRRTASDTSSQDDQCHPRKIFIGGLAHKTKTHHLREHFQRYGTIVDAVVLQWPDGRSRGFGYVTFADVNAAISAMEIEHQIGGRQVDVKRAVPGTNKLFVGGLPQNASVAELRAHFEAFGVVSDAVVMMDPTTNRSRGFGFVCFLPGQDGASAVAASLEQYNNHRIRGKWIEVKSAAPPSKLAEGSDESPHPSLPDASPASARGRPHADASARRPPAAAQGLQPARIPLGGGPTHPPGLHSEAGARMPPPGLLSMPGGKGAARAPWPSSASSAVDLSPYQRHAPMPFGQPLAHTDASARLPGASEPAKVQAGDWASASVGLQQSLAALLASHCKADSDADAFLKSPEKIRTRGAHTDSYFMQEMDMISATKAER